MRIGDILYFAPKIRFDEVHLDKDEWPEQFSARIAGFYIDPAIKLAMEGHAFAAGTLLVNGIDALARAQFGPGTGKPGEVRDRFTRFSREQLPSFSDQALCNRFYTEFRNGLVHEARLKNGAQFSLTTDDTVVAIDDILLINPLYLAEEFQAALYTYGDVLKQNEPERQRLAALLREDFEIDFRAAQG